jgi:hypothetical protein
MVLRKIFMLKRDEVTVDWRKLQSDYPDVLYSSPSIMRIWVLVRKPEKKRPLRRRRRI